MMEEQPKDKEWEGRNVIVLDLVGIGVPTIKFEKDMLNGGAEEVTTIKFKVRNLPKATQVELAAQSFANKIANLRIRLLEPSIYRVMDVDAETGEIGEPESVDNPAEFSG